MPNQSQGATLDNGGGFFATLLSVDLTGWQRGDVRDSNLGTTGGYHVFSPGSLIDPGSLRCELQFEGDAANVPPIDGAVQPWTLTIPSAGAAGSTTWVWDGYMSSFEFGLPFEDNQTATATLKLSGPPVVTDTI